MATIQERPCGPPPLPRLGRSLVPTGLCMSAHLFLLPASPLPSFLMTVHLPLATRLCPHFPDETVETGWSVLCQPVLGLGDLGVVTPDPISYGRREPGGRGVGVKGTRTELRHARDTRGRFLTRDARPCAMT